MAKILVDLDGVLCTKGHKGHYVLAQPIQKNIDKVNELARRGHQIVLFTARLNNESCPYCASTLKAITRAQVFSWGVKCGHWAIIWEKPESDFIVDDKATTLDALLAAE